MKSALKTLILFSITIVTVFLSLQSFAQPRGMTMNQVYRQVDRQVNKADQRFQTQMQMQMRVNGNWQIGASEAEPYTVTLKDSVRRYLISYMYHDSVLRKDFLIYVDDNFPKSDSANHFKKIYPDQTLSITASQFDNFGAEVPLYGASTDTGWIFRVINGPITVYARSSGYLVPVGENLTGVPKMDFDLAAIIGIQTKDAPIEKLTKESLQKIMAGDVKAVKVLEKKGLYEAVKRYNDDNEKAN